VIFFPEFLYDKENFFPKLAFVRPLRYNKYMTQTINDLINEIYESNYSHLEFEENMGGIDCDCHIHITLNTIAKYAGIEVG
jgi:hypothetical protein